jgi:hypothetical protein
MSASEQRLGRHYLKGSVGDADNTLLAGTRFSLMLLLRDWAGNFLVLILWALCALIPSRPLRRAQNYTRPSDELLRHD